MTGASRVSLANGLVLQVEDQSNRYFGDYHRVRLVVRCRMAVADVVARPDCEFELAQVQCRLGTEICFEKALERMGVAGAEVETVRRELLEQFLATSRAYLEREDFPLRLLRQRLAVRAGSGPVSRAR